MSPYHQRLLEQLEHAKRSVEALPAGIRDTHPVWQEFQERRREADRQESSRQASPNPHSRQEPQR